jgi:hypothetical protein
MTFLRLFDSPNVTACYRRTESVAPQQALALANSPLSRDQARRLARDLAASLGESPDDQAFVLQAFDRMLGREPSAEEKSTCLDYLKEQARLLSEPTKLTTIRGGSAGELKAATQPSERARENLVHVLFNHNDFITIR